MAELAALLEREASVEKEIVISEAKAKASEIVAKAKEEAKALITRTEPVLTKQHEAEILRVKSAAQLEASALKLHTQNEAVQKVFAQVEENIKKLVADKDKYKEVLNKLFLEAKEIVGEVSTVTLNPADKELLELEGLKVKTDESVFAGVKLQGKNMSTTVENSLPARLANLREELSSEVFRTLFN